MWTSPCFNHTLPLGVTVALHQACLAAKNGSPAPWRSRSQVRQVQKVQEGGDRGLRRGSSCICARCGTISSLNTTRFGPSARQRLGELSRIPLLWWMGGYEEASFTPHEPPSQFLLASNFYNFRDVTVGWFDSKIIIFLLQKCLGQNQLLTESLPPNGTGSPPPGGGGCSPLPVPASPTPVCLSLGCPLLKKPTCKGSLLLLPHRGPCGPVACALGGVAFSQTFPLGIPD